jgi:hypothetical protein
MKIEIFTGVLAAVGVLQLVVMFLTWLVYRRQAGIMDQQRETMQSQWTTMRGQLGQMELSSNQTDQLIQHAEKSAEAAKASADAALLSAQAVIDAERAWILVTSEATGQVPRGAHIHFQGKNWGRTPAEISRCSVTYLPYANEKELPEAPPYQQTELKYPKHVAPGERFPIGDPSMLDMEFTDELWEDMNKKHQRLFLSGTWFTRT